MEEDRKMEASSKKITVNMNKKALTDFVLRSYYTKLSGIMSIILGLGGLAFLVWNIVSDNPTIRNILLFGAVAVVCLVLNPLTLIWKAKNQLKTNPSYKAPVSYELTPEKLTISAGEESQDLEWNNIYRLRASNSMVAVYTSPYHAFVIPTTELGEDKSIVLSRLVQYTREYRPRLSGNLKKYLAK